MSRARPRILDGGERATEQALIRAAKAGDQDAARALVMAHYGACWYYARQYHRPGLDVADLAQEGVTGIYEALTSYDLALDTPFVVHAGYYIRRAIFNAIGRGVGPAPLKKSAQVALLMYRQAAKRLRVESGREPTEAAVFEALGWGGKRRRTYLGAAQLLRRAVPAGGPETLDLETPGPATVLSGLVNRESLQRAVALFERLKGRDRAILAARLGLDNHDEPMTLEAASALLGVGKERARQLETRALARLRGMLADPDEAAVGSLAALLGQV